MIIALKGALMAVGLVTLTFLLIVLAELAYVVLMDIIENRRRK